MMNIKPILFIAGLIAFAGWGLVGCGQTPAVPPETKSQVADTAAPATSGLDKLSKEDRALAEKQKTCPVSGELLGSMGKPVKVTVKGRVVFLCCSGCEEEIKAHPDKYLEKLPK